MRDLQSILLLFCNKFNKSNNTNLCKNVQLYLSYELANNKDGKFNFLLKVVKCFLSLVVLLYILTQRRNDRHYSSTVEYYRCLLIINMDLSCGPKTVWILVSWLHQKPADLDPQSFQKRVKNSEEKKCIASFLSQFIYI